MIGNASKTPTPRKRNVKMFGRASGYDTVADRRAERDGGDDDAEREEGEGCNQRFRAQESTFRRMLVIVRDR